MFSTIVVGTDGSDRARNAVHKATELARTCDATLHLVSAYSAGTELAGVEAGALAGYASVKDDLHASVQATLTTLAEKTRAEGIRTEIHTMMGSAAQSLIDVAATNDADLIVVGNRGMSGARRILGSVPNSVAHHASCSVLIVDTDD